MEDVIARCEWPVAFRVGRAFALELPAQPHSRIGISFPTVFRNFKVGTISITVSMSLTVVSIPQANLAIRHIVSKRCSMCRGYHVAISRLSHSRGC